MMATGCRDIPLQQLTAVAMDSGLALTRAPE